MNKSILLSLLSLFVLEATPANGAFQKIPISKMERCALRLSSAKTMPQQCIRWIDETAKLPLWKDSLGFNLGRLSYAQWQKFIQIYASWHNSSLLSPYSPQRNYALLDFMPPTLQALDRHRFYAQEMKIAGQTLGAQQTSPIKLQLVTNCWGTVYEVLRLAHAPQVESPLLFATAAQPMLEALREISTPVLDQKPGDIMLISHRHGDREYLDHAVLVIDRNLFFEKAGTGDEVPYRFVGAETLTKIWNPKIFRLELRRPLNSRHLTLPSDRFGLKQSAASTFGLPIFEWQKWVSPGGQRSHLTVIEAPDVPPTFFGIQPLPPLKRIQGRFQLPPAAYQGNALWPPKP
jgi:hypothetical protein